jgi:hypothetical protein
VLDSLSTPRVESAPYNKVLEGKKQLGTEAGIGARVDNLI